jgi:transcriptional regulator GlxA family with amidase domain
MPTTRHLAILIFEDVEVLDFCGPFEVFTVANRFTDPPAFHVFTVAEKAGPVLTRGGLSANPYHRLADCPWPDLLLVPGGQGTRQEMHNPTLIDWIKTRSQEGQDIGQIDVLTKLAGEVGLNEREFEEALRTHKYREAHRRGLRHAYEEAGVTGVPMFVIGGQVLTGLQDWETLEGGIEEELARNDSPAS